MRLVQVISDYIRRSILTIQGDLVVRGAAQPERLASGAANTLLTGQGAGSIPAFNPASIGSFQMNAGLIIRSTSGDEVISGLAYEPKLIYFQARDETSMNPNLSVAVATPDFVYQLRLNYNGTRVHTNALNCTQIKRDAANQIYAVVSAWNADGFTLTYTLAGVCASRTQWITCG